MAQAISVVEYKNEIAMIAILEAMDEPLDPQGLATYLRYRENVLFFEAMHHIPSHLQPIPQSLLAH